MEGPGHYTRGEPEQPYLDGCLEGQFVYARCRSCGEAQLAARRTCTRCGATDFKICRAKGEGTLVSFTVVHRAASEHFTEQVPFTLALVDLEEGFRAMMQFRGTDEPRIGDRVRIGFAPYGPRAQMLPFAEQAEKSG